ncbi:MAG: nucleotidyl transferase AbiEii/AbiGii toxin family protein [Smithella sp.]|jgi:predicted nucleotidyltransferase component of viral defense system
MKNYRETYIRRAEIAQLILLHQLYQQKDSRHLIFQGGTTLRWCYGGSRFSEDLDFVTSLAPESVEVLIGAAMKGSQNLMIAHFGVGALTLRDKSARAGAVKCFADFRPGGAREKISVKLEFEGLAPGKTPDSQNIVLSSLGSVAYLAASGEFRVPRANTVIVAETPEEILSDKVRALLERRYLKGRDFFDLWHLYAVLKTKADVKMIERKWTFYRGDFVARRSFQFFVKPSKEEKAMMLEAIEQDLSRFLPPAVLDVHRQQKYGGFLDAARSLFTELQDKGVCLP